MNKLFVILLLISCSSPKFTPASPIANEQLRSKYNLYSSLAPVKAFEHDCDGLLFASLLAAGTNGVFDSEDWQDDSDAYYRSVDHDHCDPTSRDMYMGLMWYFWSSRKVDLAEEVYNYGASRNWVMDSRDPKISYLWPDTQWTLALLLHRLGGPEHHSWRLPTLCVGLLHGFEAHLQSLVSGLRVLMGSGDTANEECLRTLATNNPHNAWFAALYGVYTGNQDKATALLLDESHWPSDRLPTSNEHCEQWLWQRDYGDDWLPCPDEGKQHTGGDWLLAANVVLGGLR